MFFWEPDLVGFANLFAEEDPAGFPDKSCVLIAGPPGGGKSTVALSMARSLLSRHDDARLILFSAESDWTGLGRDFEPYGWFSKNDTTFTSSRVSLETVPDLGPLNRPRGAGGLVDYVLDRIEHLLHDRSGRSGSPESLILLVDSITAILKDSVDAGERRREAHRFIRRLNGLFLSANGKANETSPNPETAAHHLVILTSEQSLEAAGLTPEPPPEEYVADIVIKLARRNTGIGQRLRTFSVNKSRAANMRIGEHTFAIVTPESIGDVIAEDAMRTLVREKAAISEVKDPQDTSLRAKWATVVISPRPRLENLEAANTRVTERDPNLRIYSGTPGLDAMLSAIDEYWTEPSAMQNAQSYAGLIPGSVTLVLGSSGSGKSLLSLQFLQAAKDPSRSFYVNFESQRDDLLRMLPDSSLTSYLKECRYLFRRRSNLDVNLWLAELCNAISPPVEPEKRVLRLVIDGLSDLLSTTPEKEYSRMVETLLSSIRKAGGGDVTVFITYEIAPNFSDFTPPTPGLSVTADNVVVLRQISIHDELRNSIYVLKARRLRHERQVREVHIQEGRKGGLPPLTVEAGFEYFGNLLAGKPEPLEIAVQLFAENEAEKKFNLVLLAHLKLLFGQKIKPVAFSRSEITRSLDDAISITSPTVRADIRVLSVDEWWIREYGPRLRTASWQKPHPLLPLNEFVSSREGTGYVQSQFWLFELEKASQISPARIADTAPPAGDGHSQARCDMLAMPSYMDFGLFCVNPLVWKNIGQGSADVSSFLERVPRVWTLMEGSKFVEANQQKPHESIVGFLAHLANQKKLDSTAGFAFDMQTIETFICVYFELCWAFGEPEDFLIQRAAEFDRLTTVAEREAYLESAGATGAIRFLQFLIRNGLMPARCNVAGARAALLSRQWYSSLRTEDQKEKPKETAKGKDRPIPLPFFPIGTVTPNLGDGADIHAIFDALEDAIRRFGELLQQLTAAATYREISDLPETIRSIFDKNEALHSQVAVAKIIPEADLDQGWARASASSVIHELRALGDDLAREAELAPALVIRPADRPPSSSDIDTLYLAAAQWMDIRDLRLLLTGHEFRLRLIEGQLRKQPIVQALGDYWQDTFKSESAPPPPDKGFITSLTGYSCTGSWLLGALRTSHSPRVCWKLIEELTSLQMAVQRSELGAGIPARKDFYEFYGSSRLPEVSHLTWNGLLLFAGARSRRRDHSICRRIRLSEISDLIYARVMHCMNLAARTTNEISQAQLDKAAQDTIGNVLSTVALRMKDGPANDKPPGRCLTCRSRCDVLFSNPAPPERGLAQGAGSA